MNFFLIPLSLEGQSHSKIAPLYGKNYYLPHLPVYSFPGFSPLPGKRGDLSFSLSFTDFNEFTAVDIENRVLDYEGSAMDLSITWRPWADLLLGVDSRVITYYGGIFDPIIEIWHNLFGFPNGGREYFPRNDVFAYVDNGSGRDLGFSGSQAGLGDTDLYGIWTFYSEDTLSMAAAGAIKLPTGSFRSGTGSDFADGGGQFLLSWGFHPQWNFHFQQGLVLPADILFSEGERYASLISFQSFLAVQFMPRADWSLIVQGRINTSPLFSAQIRMTELWGAVPLFTLPQTSVQVGLKRYWDNWSCQIYIEEDPLTYEGLDILISLRITRLMPQ